ncbi:MAG: biopolymer transport protein ExbB [Fusobacteriaceae bacterium]|jgi:biopolymer transport protein ExbB|nr:biopolymer transport protein ExbB [Fusobacteriaceae bacterium]
MLEIFKSGGPLMYIIAALSILGFAVIVERFIYFFIHERGNTDIIKEEIKVYIEERDIERAQELCTLYNNSSIVVLQGILEEVEQTHDINIENLEEKAREVALHRLPSLEKNMWLLGVTATVTPLVGLLGTVSGMIIAFREIAKVGTGNPAVLADGISQALITTAAGLTVAIPAVIFYNFFNKKIEQKINEMEKVSVEVINILRK